MKWDQWMHNPRNWFCYLFKIFFEHHSCSYCPESASILIPLFFLLLLLSKTCLLPPLQWRSADISKKKKKKASNSIRWKCSIYLVFVERRAYLFYDGKQEGLFWTIKKFVLSFDNTGWRDKFNLIRCFICHIRHWFCCGCFFAYIYRVGLV